MQILNGRSRHCASSARTACGSISGTSAKAGASKGTPPRRATNSARWAPVRVSRIAMTLDFMRVAPKHHNTGMSTKLKALMGAAMVFAFSQALCGQPLVVQPAAENDPVRDEFVTAMQRIRLHQPDLPDSAALEQYAIHDYLVAARLRRDLAAGGDDNLDTAIDA